MTPSTTGKPSDGENGAALSAAQGSSEDTDGKKWRSFFHFLKDRRQKNGAPSAANNGSSDAVRNRLLAAITGFLAVLTAIGAVNGTVAQMIRNYGWQTNIALFLEALAVLIALLTLIWRGKAATRWLFTLGVIALVAGLSLGMWAMVRTFSTSDRPKIAISMQVSGHRVMLKVHVAAEGALARDLVSVTIWPEGLDAEHTRSRAIYYSKTGPDENGRIVQDVQIETNTDRYNGVLVTAVVVSEDEPGVSVDCDGDIIDEDGSPEIIDYQPVPFHPRGRNPPVACVRIQFPRT